MALEHGEEVEKKGLIESEKEEERPSEGEKSAAKKEDVPNNDKSIDLGKENLSSKSANNEKQTLLTMSRSSSPPHDSGGAYRTFDRPTDVEEVENNLDDATCQMTCHDGGDAPDSQTCGQCKATKCKHNMILHLDVEAATKQYSKKLGKSSLKGKTSETKGNLRSPKESAKALNVAVFVKGGESHFLQLEKGKVTTAGEIKSMMLEVLSIPKAASRVFCIALVSPYLELQLKSHHVPYLLRKQWRDMLLEFSNCPDQMHAAADEPVVVFQRNSFCSISHEEKFEEETVIKRLFAEACQNFLNAKYPVPTPDAEMLGGMLTRIELGPFNETIHKPGYFRKRFAQFLPYYAIGANKIVQRMKAGVTEQRLIVQYEHASKKSQDVLSCQIAFLEYCRTLPFYGCTFFHGVVLQDSNLWKFWKSTERNVIVGINRRGLTIFKQLKQEMLFHIPYDDLSWEYLKEDGGEEAFCIEYDIVDADGEPEAQQIQILSKQAQMMDAMVDSCVNSLNVMNMPKTPTTADYSKLMDISYSTMPSKKHNFTLTRPMS